MSQSRVVRRISLRSSCSSIGQVARVARERRRIVVDEAGCAEQKRSRCVSCASTRASRAAIEPVPSPKHSSYGWTCSTVVRRRPVVKLGLRTFPVSSWRSAPSEIPISLARTGNVKPSFSRIRQRPSRWAERATCRSGAAFAGLLSPICRSMNSQPGGAFRTAISIPRPRKWGMTIQRAQTSAPLRLLRT